MAAATRFGQEAHRVDLERVHLLRACIGHWTEARATAELQDGATANFYNFSPALNTAPVLHDLGAATRAHTLDFNTQ